MFNFVGFEQLVGLKSGIWDLSSFCVWLLFLFKEVESKCVVTEVLYLPVRTELRFWHFPFPLLGFWGNYWTNPLRSSDGGSVIKSALQIQSQILFFLPSSHFHFFIFFWSSTLFFLPSGLFIHHSCIHSSPPLSLLFLDLFPSVFVSFQSFWPLLFLIYLLSVFLSCFVFSLPLCCPLIYFFKALCSRCKQVSNLKPQTTQMLHWTSSLSFLDKSIHK